MTEKATEKTEKKVAAKKAAPTKAAPKEAGAAKKAAAKSGKKVRVTLVRGLVGTRESHRATVRGLGLRRINHTVELEDTPAVRGMINKVAYLVKCEA
jgi:large subunit ribosomal protein L30